MYKEGLVNENFGTDNSTESEFACVVVVGVSEKPDVVKERLMEEISLIASAGIEKAEFDRVKKAYYGSYLRGFNNVETIGNMVTRYILSGINIFKFKDAFESVDLDFAMEVFKEIFTKENMAMSVVYPVE